MGEVAGCGVTVGIFAVVGCGVMVAGGGTVAGGSAVGAGVAGWVGEGAVVITAVVVSGVCTVAVWHPTSHKPIQNRVKNRSRIITKTRNDIRFALFTSS